MTPTQAADYILSNGTMVRQKLIECFETLGFEIEEEKFRVIVRRTWPFYPVGATLSFINYFGGNEYLRCCVGRIGYLAEEPLNMAVWPESVREIAELLEAGK
jgi:hypothetical protein